MTNLSSLSIRQQKLEEKVTKVEESTTQAVSSLTCKHDDLDNKIQVIEEKLTCIQADLLSSVSQSIQDEVSKEIKSTTQDIAKDVKAAKHDASALTQDLDRLQRRNNLMIFKVDEEENPDTAERKEADKSAVEEIFSSKLEIQCPEIVRMFRIGKFESGKQRPLKIICKTEHDVSSVLSRVNAMRKDKDPKVKELFIVPDRSKEERQRRKELRDELKRRKAAGENDIIIKKGEITRRVFHTPRQDANG